MEKRREREEERGKRKGQTSEARGAPRRWPCHEAREEVSKKYGHDDMLAAFSFRDLRTARLSLSLS